MLGVALLGGAVAIYYWPSMVGYAQTLQTSLHRDLADAMHALEARQGAAFWSLLLLSFLYGVFHAVGPGHGKVVIATYVASHPERLRRGLMISALSSLTQGVTAIVIVSGPFWLFDITARNTRALAGHLETISYGMIAALGLYLVVRAVRPLVRKWRTRDHHAHSHDHEHDHHGCGHDHCGAVAHAVGDDREGILRTGLMILSIGIRPCSGAVLILILAAALDLLVSGSLAVVAMSFGTAITVAFLAVIAQSARGYASMLAERLPSHGGLWQLSADLVAVAGGIVIMLFGLSLLEAALSPQAAHPLL